MKTKTKVVSAIAGVATAVIGSFVLEVKRNPEYHGYDVLGVAQYCEVFLKAPKLPAMSTLVQTFGNPYPCIEKRIQQGDLKVVQIDLIDATCHRNNVCAPGIPKPDDLEAIRKRAARAREVAVRYPQVEFHLSPALEHDVKDPKKVEAMCEAVKEGCPECLCVNSPFSGARPKGIPVETHNPNERTTFSISTDGVSIFDIDTTKYRTAAEKTNFAWFPEMNLRFTGEEKFVAPLKRTCKPTAALFRQAYHVLQSSSSAPFPPHVCKETRDLRGKELWKTNAESYCNADPRGNKALFISPYTDPTIDIVEPTGKTIGFLRYYGRYQDNLHRHYIGTGSGQNPYQLFKQANGEHIFLRRKNGECIRANAIRRLGYYRNK